MDAYLKGVYSGDIENFAQAVKIDPDFALAYTKMASGYFYSGLFGDIPPREAFSKMKEAALKALEKDDTLGEAHGFLAVAYLHNDLNWAEAEKEFKRAFVLNPSLAQIHHLYAHYLMAMNRIDESMSEVKLAEALDPFSWDKSQCFGWHCLFAEGYDDAVHDGPRRCRAPDPKNAWARVILGWAYEQKSMIHRGHRGVARPPSTSGRTIPCPWPAWPMPTRRPVRRRKPARSWRSSSKCPRTDLRSGL